jgi:APA family basic amino acid/polyamine antiporter
MRVMGRWTLTALVINAIIGSGIFGLPSVVARALGPASPWAWMVGAAINAIIILCFAEVASRFSGAGGAYLYARTALPRLPAILIGWLTYATRLSAVAAGVNLCVSNLGEFVPGIERGAARITALGAMLVFFAAVNYRGAHSGARLSSVFTVAKLIPLAVFVLAGLWYVAQGGPAAVPGGGPAAAPPTTAQWMQSLILIGFAFGGYDGATLALGEAKDPRRDAPFALIVAMLFLAVLYTVTQWLVNAALSEPGLSSRPLADAARVFLGPGGATLLAAGAIVSVVGFLSANFLNAPRLTYALAEHADAPEVLGRVHPRFRTPHISILLFTALVAALAVYGSFEWNATLSGVARLFVYASTCLTLVVLRRKDPGGAAIQIPGGPWLAAAGIAICALLATRMGRPELVVLLGVTGLGFVHWLAVRRSSPQAGSVGVGGSSPDR